MTPEQPKRIVELDGLRGIAIASVLWQHMVRPYLPENNPLTRWLESVTALSWTGVDLFFVLSGFFIGGILMDHRSSPRLWRVFYIRRGLRIVPVYYLVLLVLGLMLHWHIYGAHNSTPLWAYALFVPNFAYAYTGSWDYFPLGVFWTLAIEEQFYLLAPLAVRAISPRRLPWIVGSLALLAWAMRAALLLNHPQGLLAAHVLMPLRMDTLAAGVLVACMVRSEAARSFFHRVCARWNAGLAGICAIALIALTRLTLVSPENGSAELCLYGYAAIAAVFALLLAVVTIERPPVLVRILSSGPLVQLGRYSYFIYVAHSIVELTFIRWFGGGVGFTLDSATSFGVMLLALAATWGAAALSWRYVEGPLIALGHRRQY